MTDIEQRAVNVIRGLAMDAPAQARSGHSGTAMALAPLAHVLFTRVLRHDPAAPQWPDRDRFVLSAGHASILLYSVLSLCGYDLSLDDIKQFRQWGSRTPGHPEVGMTAGVEVTTGPLGQGLGNAVGMALAERWLRARFGPEVCNHHTWVLCSDGDLFEGLSHEAASLAGHQGLGRLVAVYDDNHISIDGPTHLALGDDPVKRFESYGWVVEHLGEAANDLDALTAALERARHDDGRPHLLIVRSHIGWPSPTLTDSPAAHGMPFPADDIAATKARLGLPPDEAFFVPEDVAAWYRVAGARGRAEREAWEARLATWDGDRAAYEACLAGRGLPGWEAALPTFAPGTSLATRVASNQCLDALAPVVPGLVGGGADLTANTGAELHGVDDLRRDQPAGRRLHYGVREHAMAAAMTGMALHGGLVPFGGTFFVFSDYQRPALRLAALSRAKVIHLWSHDSVGVGEDGPTHQPVEQLAGLRAVPGFCLLRPADANETAQAWRVALRHDGPVGIVLSRQAVPVLAGTAAGAVDRGAYVLVEPPGTPAVVLVGTGSEVAVCVAAAELLLAADGVAARVVSMPSWDRFAAQDRSYQDEVLPPGVPALAVEAATTFGWERWVDAAVGIDRFGASAPGPELLARFGFTPERVADAARELLAAV